MKRDLHSAVLGTRIGIGFCLLLLLFAPLQMWATDINDPTRFSGYIPTDAGLIVDLKPGSQIMLSVMIGDKEYFVCDYESFTSNPAQSPYTYSAGHTLKLVSQESGATKPAGVTIWTIEAPLTRPARYALGGITYTMRSSLGYTLSVTEGWKILGGLSNSEDGDNLCDVAFAVPTVRANYQMFSAGTLDIGDRNKGDGKNGTKTWAFDGKTGTGFAGLTYREVFMFASHRGSRPVAYSNTALVGFNTTNGNVTASGKYSNIAPGRTIFAYNAAIYNSVPRTLFRLYILENDNPSLSQPFNTCPDSYFFAYNEQDFVKYRIGDSLAQANKYNYRSMSDSTNARKIYTTDRLYCMDSVKGTKMWKTDLMYVPESDSAYYYVGVRNKYRNSDAPFNLGSGSTAVSSFTMIRQLRVDGLKGSTWGGGKPFIAPAGAYGRMVVDTTSTADNLGVAFEPAGYFLRVQTKDGSYLNVPMRQTDEYEWTSEDMWTIDGSFVINTIKATTFSGPEFSATDPGVDIAGWSSYVSGTTIEVHGAADEEHKSVVGKSGWARIYTNNAATNGGMDFVLANTEKRIRYDNNGHFGVTLPDLYPVAGSTTVTVQAPQLLKGYEFTGWNTAANGSGTSYAADDVIDFSSLPDGVTLDGDTVLTLYAQARYTGSINVAISFVKEDGKRYFLTHPEIGASRFASAQSFDDWTDVWQGLAKEGEDNTNYLSSYKIIGKEGECAECAVGEYVLDPHREVMRGAIDSLQFYENYQPASEEYIGLYYDAPYSILANNTWAGLFRSSNGWPTPAQPCVENTTLSSTHYLHKVERTIDDKVDSVITRAQRGGTNNTIIRYNDATDQFDGTDAGNGTDFMLSGVGVVDAHYVVIPDTTEEWNDEIVFGPHNETYTEKDVWSKLIGKQLLAQMTIGNKIVYFHPNHEKILTTASQLRLSGDYRLTQTFTFIPDARAEVASVATEDRPAMELTDDDFKCRITSGYSTPIGVNVDIVDTLRVRLRPTGTGRIKEYYGRWRDNAEGLHIAADGSRYRDILIRTKTYHYGETQTRFVLTPTEESYSFGPLANQSKQLNFKLYKETYHELLNEAGERLRDDIIERKDTTTILSLASTYCTIKQSHFTIDADYTSYDHVTLKTARENAEHVNYDTLTIDMTLRIGGVDYPISANVPLIQAALIGNELVWSVKHEGKRYFIMAGSDGLIFREYKLNKSYLYKNADGSTQLEIGANTSGARPTNADGKYLTPWTFAYPDFTNHPEQLTLVADAMDTAFVINGSTPGVGAKASKSTLTYRMATTYTNNNGNYEEHVRLKYGNNQWLKFSVDGSGNPSLSLQTGDSANATVFSWGYLLQEYYLLNNGTYPSIQEAEFGYNSATPIEIQTRYKGWRRNSMLLNDTITYLCKADRTDLATLTNPSYGWKTDTAVTIIRDSRTFDGGSAPSGLNRSSFSNDFKTTITPSSATSPTNVTIGGKYVNIVDTLDFRITLQDGAPTYRFDGAWSGFKSIEDAHVKIPLIRKTYHDAQYDSLVCKVLYDEYNYTFPSTLPTGGGADSTHTFELKTQRRQGVNTVDVNNNSVATTLTVTNVTKSGGMHLNNPALGEVRLVDEYGNTPDWCKIKEIGDSSIIVKCTKDGIRAPRKAYMYIAYAVTVNVSGTPTTRYINTRLTVSQPSRYEAVTGRTLIHTSGASGDPLSADGRQQTHENKRVLYYYNPDPAVNGPGQNAELPVRERGFYGWWRWYREENDQNGVDVSDSDIPDSVWQTPPQNTGTYNFPYRVIKGDGTTTMGRYTVFHYPSIYYGSKQDPPAKSPLVFPPWNKTTATYVVDISNYYDNLPLSMSVINQVDTAVLDTMKRIVEPTLSLREVFELHPWTEMAATMENYKDTIDAPKSKYRNMKYLEDHEVMAPIGNSLLLRTEQRYNYNNLEKGKHSESLLGYYMRDDNWATWNDARKDTMIWCGGWDADCKWYIFNPKDSTYSLASKQDVTLSDDFFKVPIKTSITAGQNFDTVYYCLRARSKSTTGLGTLESPDVTNDNGAYMFNICRYMVIYHRPDKYGPLLETRGKALITASDIEQNYEILEQLNFDYNRPGSDYTVYPHPLPWADASYGYSYPVGPEIPDNRYHNYYSKGVVGAPNFPGPGEYSLINRIPYSKYWRTFEQHGGAENGYMIYCDGMSSSGQVAALSLQTQLCQGQKMYFSGYVGNVSNQSGKSKPNFTFSVQGSTNGTDWHDITSYMTGDIDTSSNWYQIYFPINLKEGDNYTYFRIRIYNMASSFDGNDFVIDDMCIFATKPPLIAYQANTICSEGISDSLTHVVLRVDYQGFVNPETYNQQDIYYTIDQETENGDLIQFIEPLDHYLHESTIPFSGSAGSDPSDPGGFELGPDVVVRLPYRNRLLIPSLVIFTCRLRIM